MANNRAYLYCTKCKRHQYMAKSFGDGWTISPHESINDLFVDFMDDHFFCGSDGYSQTVQLRWEFGYPGRTMLPDSSIQKEQP